MKITIEKVANGYIVTTPTRVFVAATISGWSGVSITSVLDDIFTSKQDDITAAGEAILPVSRDEVETNANNPQ